MFLPSSAFNNQSQPHKEGNRTERWCCAQRDKLDWKLPETRRMKARTEPVGPRAQTTTSTNPCAGTSAEQESPATYMALFTSTSRSFSAVLTLISTNEKSVESA